MRQACLSRLVCFVVWLFGLAGLLGLCGLFGLLGSSACFVAWPLNPKSVRVP